MFGWNACILAFLHETDLSYKLLVQLELCVSIYKMGGDRNTSWETMPPSKTHKTDNASIKNTQKHTKVLKFTSRSERTKELQIRQQEKTTNYVEGL